MHRSPWLISAVIFFASTVSAEEPSSTAESSGDKQKSAVYNRSFDIRAYPDHLSEPESNIQAKGLVVDYYPFDASGFRISAGAYRHDQNGITDLYSSVADKTYLGVGWKKLLNDAESLDVSVEVGAFFGEDTIADTSQARNNTENSGSDLSDSFEALESAVKTVKPVISLGIHYRF